MRTCVAFCVVVAVWSSTNPREIRETNEPRWSKKKPNGLLRCDRFITGCAGRILRLTGRSVRSRRRNKSPALGLARVRERNPPVRRKVFAGKQNAKRADTAFRDDYRLHWPTGLALTVNSILTRQTCVSIVVQLINRSIDPAGQYDDCRNDNHIRFRASRRVAVASFSSNATSTSTDHRQLSAHGLVPLSDLADINWSWPTMMSLSAYRRTARASATLLTNHQFCSTETFVGDNPPFVRRFNRQEDVHSVHVHKVIHKYVSILQSTHQCK